MKIKEKTQHTALKSAGLAIIVSVLAACGGGGSDGSGGGNGNNGGNDPGNGGNTPTPPPSNIIMRPTVIEFDYDNNGIVDATSTLTYDANGRVTREEYLNSGDGTPDAFDLYDNESQITNDFSYDANGRLLVHTRTDSKNTITYDHSYDANGNVSRIDITTTTLLGTSQTYAAYTYNGTQAQKFDIHLSSDDSLLLTESFAYDMQNRIEQNLGTLPVGGVGYERRFTWDTQNRLDLLEFDGDGNGVYEITIDYIFDDMTGKLVQRINSNSIPTPPEDYDNFTEFFTYNANGQLETVEFDTNNDGSLNATARVAQRENGPCTAVYLPFLSTQAGQDGIPGSLVGDITWCD